MSNDELLIVLDTFRMMADFIQHLPIPRADPMFQKSDMILRSVDRAGGYVAAEFKKQQEAKETPK